MESRASSTETLVNCTVTNPETFSEKTMFRPYCLLICLRTSLMSTSRNSRDSMVRLRSPSTLSEIEVSITCFSARVFFGYPGLGQKQKLISIGNKIKFLSLFIFHPFLLYQKSE